MYFEKHPAGRSIKSTYTNNTNTVTMYTNNTNTITM